MKKTLVAFVFCFGMMPLLQTAQAQLAPAAETSAAPVVAIRRTFNLDLEACGANWIQDGNFGHCTVRVSGLNIVDGEMLATPRTYSLHGNGMGRLNAASLRLNADGYTFSISMLRGRTGARFASFEMSRRHLQDLIAQRVQSNSVTVTVYQPAQ